MRFQKPPLSLAQQIELLTSRGLSIADPDKGRHYLAHLNYYRLRGYWIPFEESGAAHQFRPGTSFDDILSLYVFDRRLRLLVLDLVERFEVSLRTQFAHQLAIRHGPHAHLNARLFRNAATYNKCLQVLEEEMARSQEQFVQHYFARYTAPRLPPIWAACETMSLGQLSRWLLIGQHPQAHPAAMGFPQGWGRTRYLGMKTRTSPGAKC